MARQGRIDEVPEAAKDESLRRYVEQRVALKAQIALESRTLLPQHPRMKELNAELAGLDGKFAPPRTRRRPRSRTRPRWRGSGRQPRRGRSPSSRRPSPPATSTTCGCARSSSTPKLRATSSNPIWRRTARRSPARPPTPSRPTRASSPGAIEPRTPTFPKKVPTVLLATFAGFLVSLGVVAAHALLTNAGGREGATRAARKATTRAGRSNREVETAAAEQSRRKTRRASTSPTHSPRAEALAEALAERRRSRRRRGALTTLIAGEETDRALGLALTVARGLAERGRAALVDLGLSQEWLADVVDRAARAARSWRGSPSCSTGARLRTGAAPRSLVAPRHRSRRGRRDRCAGLGEALAAFAASYDSSCCTPRTGDRRRRRGAAGDGGAGRRRARGAAARGRCARRAKRWRARRSRRSAWPRATRGARRDREGRLGVERGATSGEAAQAVAATASRAA